MMKLNDVGPYILTSFDDSPALAMGRSPLTLLALAMPPFGASSPLGPLDMTGLTSTFEPLEVEAAAAASSSLFFLKRVSVIGR